MQIIDKEIELIENLETLTTWEERYQYIIELGESLPKMNLKDKVDANLIKGCQSKLWLSHNLENNKIHFYVDSESPFPKGLGALFILILNDSSPKEILSNEVTILEKTELKFHLSPLRYRGITNLYKAILNTCRQYENLD